MAIPFPPVSGLQQGAISGHLGAISGAKMFRDSLKMASRWPNMGSRWAKDVPKMASRWTNMAVRWPQRPFPYRGIFWEVLFYSLFGWKLLRKAKPLIFPRYFNVLGPFWALFGVRKQPAPTLSLSVSGRQPLRFRAPTCRRQGFTRASGLLRVILGASWAPRWSMIAS